MLKINIIIYYSAFYLYCLLYILSLLFILFPVFNILCLFIYRYIINIILIINNSVF